MAARRGRHATPACNSTPATRACAKCRCCTTNCARCSRRRRDGEPPLQPRDIAVLAPDIDAYAPHVEAVFGGALGTRARIALHASPTPARSRARRSPKPSCACSNCRCAHRRSSDVLDLLAVPAIAARFGLEDADRMRVQDWLESAGARWGLDAARSRAPRRRRRAPTRCEFAIDRLLLGYASGDDEDIAGVAPWPELEGQAAERSMRCCACVAMLRDSRTRLARPHPPARWASTLQRLMRRAFALDATAPTRRRAQRLRDAIGRFADGARDRRTTTRRSNTRSCSNTARRTRQRRCARAVPVRRHLLRPHGADAPDPVPRDLPARHGGGSLPRARTPRSDQPHRHALGTRERRSGDPSRAMRTATCSCSCSRPPAACCT
jgi:hypothetical protein